MIDLKRIIVASDFSDHSTSAIRFGSDLARRFGSDIIGLHILDTSIAALAQLGHRGNADLIASGAREKLEQQLKETGADQFRVLIEKGKPCHEIVRIARNEDADLILLGSHGHDGMTHLLLGSTAENVVRLAGCPVLVIPARFAETSSSFSDERSSESLLS